MLGIGIDTGGTCTDAVIYDMDTKQILGAGKALTTKSHLETGIANALDTLPADLVSQAERLSLSTTLATNACVENKGARSKLLMIGFERDMIERLKDVYASYGFRDLTDFIVLDAKAENLFSDAFDPDWEELRRRAPEYFADCDSVGIVQKHPQANGGRFELTARRILQDTISIPITIACDISHEVDIIKTCVGTLLNARLIPLITEFMDAVHHVMEQRGLNIPISIVRSDGCLMSEEMAKTCPVETLLCGPAASVVGGGELAGEPDAMVIDMGGTTTDIAIVHGGKPLMTSRGIHIGQWTTMVNGLYVDTFGLGGDSAVRFAKGQVYLDTVRVIPLSILASQYDDVLPRLQELAGKHLFHNACVHEFFVLQKDISGKSGYTEEEQKICRCLKDGPLISLELASLLGYDPHYIRSERLESAGILMRSGLTPTDIMILKGDYSGMNPDAAKAALECFAPNIDGSIARIPDRVYDLVIRRMYQNIARVLLEQQYPDQRKLLTRDFLDSMLDCCYEQAVSAIDHPELDSARETSLALTTNLPLVGVGAPIHVFLPRVAALLHTRAVIPPHAGVANAVGAIASRLSTRVEVNLKVVYKFGAIDSYTVFRDGRLHTFKDYNKAEKFAAETARLLLQEKIRVQGLPADTPIKIHARRETIGPRIHYQTVVEASADDT